MKIKTAAKIAAAIGFYASGATLAYRPFIIAGLPTVADASRGLVVPFEDQPARLPFEHATQGPIHYGTILDTVWFQAAAWLALPCFLTLAFPYVTEQWGHRAAIVICGLFVAFYLGGLSGLV